MSSALALGLVLAACAVPAPESSASPSPSASPRSTEAPTPIGSDEPTPEGALTVPALKYRLIDRLGRPWFCDPDEYPVARDDERQIAIQRFDEVRADADAFTAILERLALVDDGFSDDEKLAIYREWKTLNAMVLDAVGDGSHRFDLLTVPPAGADQGTRSEGTIDERGTIQIDGQRPAGEPICPICLAPGTLIDTPQGPIAVEELRVGSPIWTRDAAGQRVAVSVVATGNVRARPDHRFVRLMLADGRQVMASPGHPLADGRRIGSLVAGDTVDGSTVLSAELVGGGSRTFDLLPSGPTGVYWAGGIPLGSTLAA